MTGNSPSASAGDSGEDEEAVTDVNFISTEFAETLSNEVALATSSAILDENSNDSAQNISTLTLPSTLDASVTTATTSSMDVERANDSDEEVEVLETASSSGPSSQMQSAREKLAAFQEGLLSSMTAEKPYMSGLNGRKIQSAKRRTEGDKDLSTRRTNNKCLNEVCLGGSNEFVKAPPYAAIYYGCVPSVDWKCKKPNWICSDCMEDAKEYLARSKIAVKNGKSVFNVPISSAALACSTVVLENSDSEEEGEDEIVIEDVEFDDSIPEDMGVDQILGNFLTSLSVRNQIDVSAQVLEDEIDTLETEFEKRTAELDQASVEVEKIRGELQDICGPSYNSIVLKCVDIDGTTGKLTTIAAPDENVQAHAREILAGVGVGPNLAAKTRELKKNVESKVRFDVEEVPGLLPIKPMSKPKPLVPSSLPIEEIKPTKQVTKTKILAATPAVIPRIMPKVGDLVFGMTDGALCYWNLGRVERVAHNGVSGQLEYKVKFKGGRKGYGRDAEYYYKFMSPKHLAYNLPCPFVLPVGTRIIARFRDEFNTEPGGADNFYAGIVAEPPKANNSFRYLIFFDDGYAQYERHEDVLLVCESSKEVWHDVYPDSQDFAKEYIQKYPERPMVRLTQGTIMTTEWNGNWYQARIVEVDASLAKVYFIGDGRYEWIYRGSTRLAPLYNKALGLKHDPTPKVPRRQRAPNSKSVNQIEYTYDLPPASRGGAQTARKSTATPPVKPNGVSNRSASGVAPAISDLIAYEGKFTKITIEGVAGPTEYQPHNCKPSCVRPYSENAKEIKLINPLSLPMYLGWARETCKTPRRAMFYRAPCGRRLRDYSELLDFLKQTKYNMGVDHFCFDIQVDCVSEFAPSRHHFLLQDISNGEESVPVQCVNSIDHDYPEYVKYAKHRVAGKDVEINTNEEFLACCDCTDDCSDKLKCACWRTTMEGTMLSKDKYNLQVGYQNRRLLDHIITGIYECNSRCKCRSTCLNRVVQNNMKSHLQLFKTANKGWAIRPLHDIPHGAFVCVYAGQVLTDASADEDGKSYGDEYLAELDFIEHGESVKEGYEADAVEDDSERAIAQQEANKRRHKTHMYDDEVNDPPYGPESKKRKKTGNSDLIHSHAGKMPSGHARINADLDSESEDEDKPSKPSARAFFGPNEKCYILDAKAMGNVGRYMNHSCSPNIFVQNVFVDTHDIRFPWVCFFANKHIRAGTELTWDYNYDVGSVPGRTMYCYCGSPDCRGRLL